MVSEALLRLSHFSRVRLCANPCKTCQTPLSMGLPWQEYWNELPFPPPGDIPDPGIEPASPALASGFFTTELAAWEAHEGRVPEVKTSTDDPNYILY